MKYIIDIKNQKLTVQFNEQLFTQSSLYYYAIDENFRKDDESISKVESLIKNNHKELCKMIESSSTDHDVYFPITFEDEYIGILKIRLLDERSINIEYLISTDIYGYSILPSKPNMFRYSESLDWKLLNKGVIDINEITKNWEIVLS